MDSTTQALLVGLVLVAALIVPLFFLFRMASAPPEEPKEVRQMPKVRKDKDRSEGKKKGKKGALDRMRDAKEKGGDADQGLAGDMGADDAAGDNHDEDIDGKKAQRRAERTEAARAREAEREAMRERDEQKAQTRAAKEEEREAKYKAKEEAERLRKEEEEKQQQAEFDKWKDLITVDDEGTDEAEVQAEDQGLLKSFVDYIKQHKVVVLEDLAATFELRVQDVISRVQGLEAMGYITGVVDDRGKFIYLSVEEMDAVANFINKRGRVSIAALASESNKLIDLNSKVVDPDPVDDDDISVPDADAGDHGR